MIAPRIGRVRIGTLIGVTALVVLVARLTTLGDYSAYVLAVVGVAVIAALSLNLLMGYAGQVSLGQAALVGVGAYAVHQFQELGAPFPLDFVAAITATVVIATVIGLPSLRIRGLHLAALTLAFGIAAERLIFARPWDTRSTAGVVVRRPDLLDDDRSLLVVVIIALIAVLLVDRGVRAGKVGRSFVAVRDREDNAAAWGIAVGRTKLLAYAVSGLYAGVAGGLYAYVVERLTPTPFDVWRSLGYVAAVVIGGAGSVAGVAVVQAALSGAPELFRSTAEYTPLAGAMLLTLLPVLRPEGLGWLLERTVPFPVLGRRGRVTPAADAPEGRRPPEDGLERTARPLSMSMPVHRLLSVRDLWVRFHGLQVFHDLSMDVERGELVGVIGPNGAGKTTLFNVISGFVPAERGRVTYRGQDLLTTPAWTRPSLGIARSFQHAGLCPSLSVWDNVLVAQHEQCRYSAPAALVRTPSVRITERQLARRADAALDALGLRDLAHRRVGALPYGKQRLTEVAALVATGPELLLLDEPAAGLDPDEAAELAEVLRVLRDRLELTVVVIEHHLPFIADLCSYVYVLADGGVVAHGGPAAVQQDPAVVAIYVGEQRRPPYPEAVAAGG